MKKTLFLAWRLTAAALLYGAFSQVACATHHVSYPVNAQQADNIDFRAPPAMAKLSNTISGTTRLQFSKTGGPQDRIQGQDVWTSSGLGIGVPPQAVVVAIKNVSKYQIVLGREEKSKDGTHYNVVGKITLAGDASTPAFAGENWATRWVIYGPTSPNPREGRPQIEITWRIK